jgi:hypothetical protein
MGSNLTPPAANVTTLTGPAVITTTLLVGQGPSGPVGPTGPTPTVAGAAGQVQYSDGTGALASSAKLVTDPTTGALTIAGASVAASAPIVNASQAWNNAAVTFTGWKFNVTDTASAVASLLADWQVGGVSKFALRKDGNVNVADLFTGFLNIGATLTTMQRTSGQNIGVGINGSSGAAIGNSGVLISSPLPLGFSSTTAPTSPDVFQYRGGPGILEQRNGLNAQARRLFNTFTNSSTGEWFEEVWSSNQITLQTTGNGTGVTTRALLMIGGGLAKLNLNTSVGAALAWGSSGYIAVDSAAVNIASLPLKWTADNALDIGLPASGRPRTGYFGTSVVSPAVRTTPLTVATLPSASTSGAGTLAYVTDANATTYRSIVAAGGANKVQVQSDGSNWLITG